jgi:hypothetical protein
LNSAVIAISIIITAKISGLFTLALILLSREVSMLLRSVGLVMMPGLYTLKR